VQRRTPVRTFNGWGEVKEAGWLEIDLVAIDVATGWSDCLPLLNRDGSR